MTLRRRTVVLLMLAAMAAASIALAAAGPAAAAASDRFSCRASAARVILLGSAPIEPILANDKNDPCVSETRSGTPPANGGAVSLGAAQAQTVAAATSGAASARVADVGVNLGPTLLPLQVLVQGVNAQASYFCQGTTLAFAGNSQVAGISINGLAINIPDPNAPLDIDLGDILTIHLNQTVVTKTGDLTEVTKRAVFIESKLLATQIALGEARAGVAGNPCAGNGLVPTPGPGTVTTITVPVPSGSIAGISPGIVPGACATKPFTVTVRGRGIARTVFSVDGKTVAAVGKSNTPSFQLDPAKVAIGLHKVRAVATFTDKNVKPKVLNFVFGRCGAVIPSTAQFGKCANIRVTNTSPGTVFVKLTSGPKSVRLFGGHLYHFTKPGTRVVCFKIPLRARNATVGTTRRFTVAVKVGGKNFIRTLRVS
jgi:hypothetical protein